MDFWALGQELFNDRDRFEGRFVQADVLDRATLNALEGRFDVVVTSKVLHQWQRAGQVAAAKNLVGLVKGKGAMIVGEQPGTGGERPYELMPRVRVSDEDGDGGKGKGERKPGQWTQTAASWREMWAEVARETGTQWEVEVAFREWAEDGIQEATVAHLPRDMGMLHYVMTML